MLKEVLLNEDQYLMLEELLADGYEYDIAYEIVLANYIKED
jgi:hypothetical protein